MKRRVILRELLSSNKSRISAYLDIQATSSLDLRVLDKMLPSMTHTYGNTH